MNPAEEGSDDAYRAPEAELREDLPKRSWRHPLAGFAGGLVGLLALGVNGGNLQPRDLVLSVVAAIAAGVVLALVRRLPWFVGALLGFPLALVGFMVGSVLLLWFGPF